MLTADAFGVLPPIARLTHAQAMYHFLAGYTAKVAGTEVGITEPQTTFSACFGAPFLPQRPIVYAHMLGKLIEDHNVSTWLVNTGWTGGPYGVGHRMPIAATRALVRGAISGELERAATRIDPTFGFAVPLDVPGVDSRLLDPRSTWADPAKYDETAAKLAARVQLALRRVRRRRDARDRRGRSNGDLSAGRFDGIGPRARRGPPRTPASGRRQELLG